MDRLNEFQIDKKIEITRVKLLKNSRKVCFHIAVETLLPLEDFLVLKNLLAAEFLVNNYVVELVIDNKNKDLYQLKSNEYEKIFKYLVENKYNLKNSDIAIKSDGNVISLAMTDNGLYSKLKNGMNEINKMISSFGMPFLKVEVLYGREMDEKLENKKKQLLEKAKSVSLENDNGKKFVQKNKVLFGNPTGSKVFAIDDILNPDLMMREVTIQGKVFNKELRELKKSALLTIMVKDATGTIVCKSFTGFNNQKPTYADLNQVQVGMEVEISGKKTYDRFIDDEVIEMNSIRVVDSKSEITKRVDRSDDKRIELHLHTKMSRNNGINSMDDYARVAKKFGHSAIAVTDHDGVQGFVDAERASKAHDLKIVYGVESVVVDKPEVVRNPRDTQLQDEVYTVFDLETTGLSANFNKMIEIGAVKIKNGQIIDRFQQFIKIDHKLGEFTTELTGITDEDLAGGVELGTAIKDFKDFYEDTVLVAHNATFDYQFLNKNEIDVLGDEIKNPVLDTLELSRILNPDSTFHSLKILSRKYGVPMDHNSHHRADYDSEKLSEIFILMLQQIKDVFPELQTLEELNATGVNKTRGTHDLIYVRNQEGLADLYELISRANTEDYLMESRVRRKYLDEKRKNLIIVGSGCTSSKIVDYYLNKPRYKLEELMEYYDYIDLNPVGQYEELLLNDTFKTEEEIQMMQEEIIEIAKKVNTPVFASSNAHFINPDLSVIKEILLAKDFKPEKMKKDKETGEEIAIDKQRFSKLLKEKRGKYQSQYLHTTEEMKLAFDFLDADTINEIVVENTNKLVDEVDELKIIPDKLYTPTIDGVEEKLKGMVYSTAKGIYGQELPEIVDARIQKELNSIITYGFSVIYYISHKLVKHSLDHGYLVGSRGSVGSSIVATFMDITEINPLPAHYVCDNCQNSEFFVNGEYASGYDLPDKSCPNCGNKYRKNGQDIPFETFLGFKGDKVPDIDLNFSGDFQAEAHDYVRSRDRLNDPELFDDGHAYRAGTIGTIAEKTAFAYTRNYFELIGKRTRKSDILFYSKECEGIKRTTGQHPGGIIVVPEELEIYEFTPIQYPANDVKQPWKTTHFDFHSIHDNLLKLDILGHDDPTMLKKLFDLTGKDPKEIDVSDEKIMQLFTSTESLGIEADELFDLGTMGIPEFGTDFVMGMLKDTKPASFSELVQISGLSHGTDVWLGNAKVLIDNNIATLKEVIGCRDDIMVYLMYQGIDPSEAFSIMENVRKGKGLTNDEITILKENDIPSWYIDSCQKIKYMFPKAHAAAYVLMALRIAYYKVYYPLEYYCAYFSSRISDFDPISMINGESKLRERIGFLQANDIETSDLKKKNLMNSLKMSLEMSKRGFKFLRFDLEKSEAFEFVIDREQNGLIMPFGIIDGLGDKEARALVEEREKDSFQTKEDLKKRTKIKAKSLEQLEYFDVLESLEESNQMSLF